MESDVHYRLYKIPLGFILTQMTIRPMSPHLISVRPILVLSSIQRPHIRKGSFPIETLHTLLSSPHGLHMGSPWAPHGLHMP
jgi:hypothetical protein